MNSSAAIAVISWPTDTSPERWLVTVSPIDGSYYPIAKLDPPPNGTRPLQSEHDQLRAQYMKNVISHDQFYQWLSGRIGLNKFDLPVPVERVRASTDPHLNDIPLGQWDRLDPIVRGKAVRAGMRAWSLSDSVCCLKATARRLAAEPRATAVPEDPE